MSTLCYCQNTYPKKIVFDNDTCVALSLELVKTINLKLQRKAFLQKENEILLNQVRESNHIIDVLKQDIETRDSLLIAFRKESDQVNELVLSERKLNARLKRNLDKCRNTSKLLVIISALGLISLLAN